MRSQLKLYIAVAVAVLALSALCFGASEPTSTTLSAAINRVNDREIHVTSATGFSSGTIAWVNGEAMRVRSVSGTTIKVSRGVSGTLTGRHASGSTIYVGPAAYGPYRSDPPLIGSYCLSTEEAYLPQISLSDGRFYTCTGSKWIEVDRSAAANTFAWPDSGEADGATTTTDNALMVYRIYVPQSIKVGNILFRTTGGTDSGADDTLAAAIYEDSDAGARLTYGQSADITTSAADITLDVPDVYIGPGMYRFAFCAQDVSGAAFHANTVDDEYVDVVNKTTVMRGTGANACVAGVPPSTTGALTTSDEHSIVFKLE